jgi:hypothetical protein
MKDAEVPAEDKPKPSGKRKAEGEAETPPGQKQPKVSTTKWTKARITGALDDSEQACLKFKQFFNSLQDAKLIIGITEKSYEALIQLCDKRLSSELVNMYGTNFDDAGNMTTGEPESDTRAMVRIKCSK